jgi:hypothetical protein
MQPSTIIQGASALCINHGPPAAVRGNNAAHMSAIVDIQHHTPLEQCMSFHLASMARVGVGFSFNRLIRSQISIWPIKITFLEVGRLGTSIVAASRLGDEDLCTSFELYDERRSQLDRSRS